MSGDDNELFFHALIASLLLRPRMRLVVNVLQLPVYQLRINLHRAYIPMPEHFPDRTYIRAVFQQVRGEGMAKRMRSDILLDARHLLIVLDYLPETLSGHVLPADVDEEGLFTWAQDHLWSYHCSQNS